MRVQRAGFVFIFLMSALGGTALADNSAQPTAQPATPSVVSERALSVELNALAPSQKGCMMTFVARNGMDVALEKLSFELALFNQKDVVDRITVLDFRDLPVNKVRVRQFDMPGVACDGITRIIVNDTPVCAGPAAGGCMKNLITRSQLSIPFEG